MLRFEKNVEDRKELVKRLGELTGIHPVYMRTPTYAFACGDYTVDRDGFLLVDEERANADVLTTLMNEGLISGGEVVTDEETEVNAGADVAEESEQPEAVTEPEHAEEQDAEPEQMEESEPEEEQDAEEEPETEHTDESIDLNMAFPIPIGNHSGTSLRNLVNLIFSRGWLINKATGGHFKVEAGLVEALKDDTCTFSTANFRKAVGEYERNHGKSIYGLTITPEEVTFTGFGEAADVEHLEAYGHLALMMNEQAISQKRIQAKTVDDSNEKYAMRIWLVRIGMGGDAFKKTRAVLMENLGGHTAFRTAEEAEKAKEKARKKRDALKAAKAAQSAEANTEQQEP